MSHTHCTRCGRPLRSTTSRTRGYGAHCGRIIRTTATTATTYKPEQIEAAIELIEDGGIHTLRPGRVWLTISTDGTATHRTAHNACTCKAGLRGANCYHRAAVHLLAA